MPDLTPILAPIFADAINPILVILLLGAPFYTLRPAGPWAFWARTALSIGLAVILAESGKHFEIWRGHPSFPSGHETFGLAAAVSLVLWDSRWFWLTAPLILLLSWGLVGAHYHQPVDIAGACLLGPPSAFLCHFAKRRHTR